MCKLGRLQKKKVSVNTFSIHILHGECTLNFGTIWIDTPIEKKTVSIRLLYINTLRLTKGDVIDESVKLSSSII